MSPKKCNDIILWRNPTESAIVFGVLLFFIIVFQYLPVLTASSFCLLVFLILIGIYKFSILIMEKVFNHLQNDISNSFCPSEISISDRQAEDMINYLRFNGTDFLQNLRTLLLWKNFVNSALFGLTIYGFNYVSRSMHPIVFAVLCLFIIFTIPKLYEIYRVPINNSIKQIRSQVKQSSSTRITSTMADRPKQN